MLGTMPTGKDIGGVVNPYIRAYKGGAPTHKTFFICPAWITPARFSLAHHSAVSIPCGNKPGRLPPSGPTRLVGCGSHTWEARRSSILLIFCSIAAALARLTGKERQKQCLPLYSIPFLLTLACSIVSVVVNHIINRGNLLR